MLPDCETIANGPGLMSIHFEHCVHRQRERRPDAEDADAIGAEHAHAARARDRHHFFLHAAAFFAGFGEAVAVDGRGEHFLLDALLDRRRDRVFRHHDERVLDDFRHRHQVRIRFLAENLVAPGIDGHDAAGIAVFA